MLKGGDAIKKAEQLTKIYYWKNDKARMFGSGSIEFPGYLFHCPYEPFARVIMVHPDDFEELISKLDMAGIKYEDKEYDPVEAFQKYGLK